jgi:hypothetical protein
MAVAEVHEGLSFAPPTAIDTAPAGAGLDRGTSARARGC